MERRRAIAVAGSLTITAFAGAVAAGASTGLFGLGTVGGAAAPATSVVPVSRPAPKVVEITIPAHGETKPASSSGAVAPVPSAGSGSAAPALAPAPAPLPAPVALAAAPAAAAPVPSGVREPDASPKRRSTTTSRRAVRAMTDATKGAKRANPPRRSRPAAGARIIAAALSVSSLFAVVSLLTLRNPEPTAVATSAPPSSTVPPQEVIVVIREVPAATPEPAAGGDGPGSGIRARRRRVQRVPHPVVGPRLVGVDRGVDARCGAQRSRAAPSAAPAPAPAPALRSCSCTCAAHGHEGELR